VSTTETTTDTANAAGDAAGGAGPALGGGDETATSRAEAYLAVVRRHLDAHTGLSGDERDDLLDELATHVDAVASADDRPLDQVLGTPTSSPTSCWRRPAWRQVARWGGRAAWPAWSPLWPSARPQPPAGCRRGSTR
jgi:hypothetical protein